MGNAEAPHAVCFRSIEGLSVPGGEKDMRKTIRYITLAAFIGTTLLALAPNVHAQTANETNSGLPGGHSGSDTNKPANGEHGNNGGNGE